MFGFPYVDTLKMMTRTELNPGGAEFLGQGELRDLERLHTLLQLHNGPAAPSAAAGGRIAAIFTEFPSNPLLKCPDLRRSVTDLWAGSHSTTQLDSYFVELHWRLVESETVPHVCMNVCMYVCVRLSALAAAFDCLLVVDDTISGFSNVDLFRSQGKDRAGQGRVG